MLAIGLVAVITGCKPLLINGPIERLAPSNARSWTPELAVLPSASIDGDRIELKNIRNINYLSDDDFVIRHFDRTIRKSDVQSVDFVVTPFQNLPLIAHTMLSFGLSDGSYLAVSVEIRNELEEDYSALLGFVRQYELAYVIADERDLIRVRTHHRDADVYLYPSVASPQQAQQLFVSVLERLNRLGVEPEFYNTIANNCTTNIVKHVNEVQPERIRWTWRVLLPGFSPEYAYDLGLLDNRVPFEDLKASAYVNELVERHYSDPDFSRLIRAGQDRIDRLVQRQQGRESSPGGRRIARELGQQRRLVR